MSLPSLLFTNPAMSLPKTGSCLCHSIRYELLPNANPVYNVVCHCIKCRRNSDTHFACASIYYLLMHCKPHLIILYPYILE